MTRFTGFSLTAYGACTGVEVALGPGVTVVLGENEAGKSTALAALSDLLWGIPTRTPWAFLHTRQQLRIDATLADDGDDGVRHLVRRATGLVAADLVTPVSCPWDPEGTGTAEWWRTRLGLDLDRLRAGGEEVFTGGGDLAELVFAAREGRSARVLLDDLRRTGEDLFKAHGGAKNVKLRLALAAYEAARTERDARITRSDDVTRARLEVERLEGDLAAAQSRAVEAARRVRRADEAIRVVEPALTLAQARAALGAIDAEGPRLSPAELAELESAEEGAATARADLETVHARATVLAEEIAALAVDEDLLADAATLARLHPDAAARIADLRRAEEEYAPAADVATRTLIEHLAGLGIVATAETLAADTAAVRLGAVQQADLDEAAGRLADARDEQASAIRRRDEALAALASRGVVVDPVSGAAPRQDLLERQQRDLIDSRAQHATKNELLEQARGRLTALREAGPTPPPPAGTTAGHVSEARDERDRTWRELRTAWEDDAPPARGVRSTMADRVEAAMQHADRTADAEADERARISAHDARLAAHVEGVAAAREAVEDAERALAAAVSAEESAETAWQDAWVGLGLAQAPTTDAAPELASLIAGAFGQQALADSAAAAIDEAAAAWESALARADLPPATTIAAWQARQALLEALESAGQDRVEALSGAERHRAAWESFARESVTLLVRHGELVDGADSSPADIERALERLDVRRRAAERAQGKREGLADREQELADEQRELAQAIDEAGRVRTRLADQHGTDPGPGLEVLAERARRAQEPLERERDSWVSVKSGVDQGSAIDEVLARLADVDIVAAEQERESASRAHDEAQAAVNDLLEQRTSARDRRDALESAGSAAAAEALVEQRRSELVSLVEQWSIVTLQRRLLERALARVGTDDTRPLLDHAGRILDRITQGRYPALRAEEDATSRSLSVLRSDGSPLETGELSEGTADQVYFALRLAAIAELHRERLDAGLPALPVVLDDVLMAFDDARTARALEVLHDLAEGLQVVVFTHHARVADVARGIDGVVVAELPTPAAIEGALDGEAVRAAARLEAAPTPTLRRPSERRDGDPDPSVVRAWALENGIHVNAKGRIPKQVLDRYLAARD